MHCSAHKHCRLGLAHGATRSSRQWGSLRLSESQRQGCRTSASKKSQKIVAQQPMLAPRYPLAFCQPDFGFHPHKAASSLQHHSGVSRRHHRWQAMCAHRIGNHLMDTLQDAGNARRPLWPSLAAANSLHGWRGMFQTLLQTCCYAHDFLLCAQVAESGQASREVSTKVILRNKLRRTHCFCRRSMILWQMPL